MTDYVKNLKQKAMNKLDSYLQSNVDRAYELGEVFGDVAAGGAALSSAAADTLLPDSSLDLLPVGKLMKGVKKMKAMSNESKAMFRRSAHARGMDLKQTEDALAKIEASGDPRALARRMQALESTQATRGIEGGADKLRQSTQKVEQLRALTRPAQAVEATAKPVQFQKLEDPRKTVTATVGAYKPDAAQSAAAAAGGQRARQAQEAGMVRANHVPGEAAKKKRLEEDELAARLEEQ